VAEGFLNDRYNDGKNTYQPLFGKIALYVESVISGLNTEERLAIQDVGKVAYAAKYSPESFMQYLQVSGNSTMKVTGMPAPNNPMMSRIERLKNHEYMFIDRMQEQYAQFDKDTETSYQSWQRAALSEVKKQEEARNRKIGSVIVGILGAALAVNANKRNSTGGDVVRDLAVVGTAVAAANAMSASREQAEQAEIINEMGEAADLEMSPMEMQFEGQKTELKGTASEQYTQWRAHLKKIWLLENKTQ
ncbi:MAG: hypothetical protein R3194_12365, partial [Limnobacter sp.]|nr:hypothetical protein [Limnobacter sp.]